VGAEFHADGQTGRTKLLLAFCNFANVPQNTSWQNKGRCYLQVKAEVAIPTKVWVGISLNCFTVSGNQSPRIRACNFNTVLAAWLWLVYGVTQYAHFTKEFVTFKMDFPSPIRVFAKFATSNRITCILFY